ncbi:MAG TPA: class I SAM-dependent methyltransferase [Acidobacteriaceae bacterium]
MTNLNKLKNAWEGLAGRDALSAILTDDTKAGGKWDVAEFMATGDAEIETVLNHLSAIGYPPDFTGAALDFGCGVGRLTQALAQRFASSVGVDISEHMIRQAESLNRYPHCRYVASSAARLPFANASFTFLYSNIVLQHVPRSLAKNYLREFVRVLAPAGVLVFGVQDSFAAPDLASRLVRVRHVLHLRSRIRVALKRGPEDMQMHCLPERIVRRTLTSAKVVDIQFTNTAARDFNGRLVYLDRAPASGYVGKQYCVVKGH